MSTSANWDTRHLPYGASITLTKPTGLVGSASRAAANSGRKYSSEASESDSGSFAIDQITTLGRFLSRAMRSSISRLCAFWVLSFIVSGLYVT